MGPPKWPPVAIIPFIMLAIELLEESMLAHECSSARALDGISGHIMGAPESSLATFPLRGHYASCHCCCAQLCVCRLHCSAFMMLLRCYLNRALNAPLQYPGGFCSTMRSRAPCNLVRCIEPCWALFEASLCHSWYASCSG